MTTDSDIIRRSVLERYDGIARAEEASPGCGCDPADGAPSTVATVM